MRKIHMYIGDDKTACGRSIVVDTVVFITTDIHKATCGNCLRARKTEFKVVCMNDVDPDQVQLFPDYGKVLDAIEENL